MSETTPFFIHHRAKKQSGEPAAVFWESAKTENRALRDADNALEDAGKDPANYFKALVTNFPAVNELPPEGEISFTFCDFYQLGDDGMTWAQIPGVTLPSPNAEKVIEGSDSTIVDGVDISTGEVIEDAPLPESDEESEPDPIDTDPENEYADDESAAFQLTTMPFRIQLLAQYVSEERHVYHISMPQRRILSGLEMDTDNHAVQDLILAAENVPEIKSYDMPALWKFTSANKKVFPEGKRHELGLRTKFAKLWFETNHLDRGILVREWAAGNHINGVQRTDSGTNADGGYLTDRGEGAHHTLDSLDLEIACATLPMDFNPHEIPGSILRRAKEVIAKKEEPWKSWSFILRNIPGILGVNRFAIFNLLRIAPENIHENAVKHLEFVVETMTDEFNKAMELLPLRSVKQELSSEDIDKLLASERGEFVEGISDPTDPKWDKTPGKQSTVTNLGGGVFSIDNLMNQNASNEGEKPEVESTSHVQIQEVKRDEEPAGDALLTSESGDVAVEETVSVTTNANILAAAAPNLAAGHNDGAVTQNDESVTLNADSVAPIADFDTQNEDSVNQSEPEWPTHFEPGRYENLPNEVYHSANGISSTMLKDARISLMYYDARHVAKTIPREETKAFLFGGHSHAFILEPGKIDAEYAVPVAPPEGLIRTTADMTAIIKAFNDGLPTAMSPEDLRTWVKEYNASLTPLMTPEELKAWIEAYNNDLTPPLSLSGSAEETGMLYMSLPDEFQRLPTDGKPTATQLKSCIKEYNSSLPPMLKTSGTREQLLDQIASVAPEMAAEERAKPQPFNTSGSRDQLLELIASVAPEIAEAERSKRQPYNVSGSRAQLVEIVREIKPEAVLQEDFDDEQERIRAGRTYISLDMYQHVKAIEKAVFEHPSASRLLNHPSRQSEVSYFGFDEDTGLEVRVRPDLELQLPHARIGGDLKTIDLGNVKQERLRDRLHREIIERDYHLSAAMYCDVANLDQFYWIFVNKTPDYHWVVVVEASPDLLALGRLEYRRTLRMINEAMETNTWPAPIVEDYTDELNDFDLRRLEALGAM